MSKEILFNIDARDQLKKGIDTLANAVKITLGPKGRNVIIEKKFGAPHITKDGVTVAKEVELADAYQNTGAQLVKEVASKTGDDAGDGTTTATVLAQAIVAEGLKNVTAGASPMDIKRGIDKAVAKVVESIKSHRDLVCPRIAYMPQGLGKNLYPTLSVEENLQFFARLFGHNAAERRRRIDDLTRSTGLHPFLSRPAGKLSGGMKQKLGLCCALIHDPDLLILDEPTTGVDPLARSQFWELIERIRGERNNMSVLVATAYMDEAQGFDWLVAMDDGEILTTDTPQALLEQTGSSSLESAFIHLLPESKKQGYQPVTIPPLVVDDDDIAIEAEGLTMRFGDFVAVDNVSFRIRRGEIFGFLGSNGCGKSTTMKMLTGLLPASEGKAWLFGEEIDPDNIDTRRRVGYMSQAFSLYSELTVKQNLVLHAQLFHVPADQVAGRVAEVAKSFGLEQVMESLPNSIPLGMRQRLSLAVAMVHKPDLLILDEPTSGVDPVARDNFWRLLIELSRRDKVTIFISTHFMNEAERCDRMSMMHAGKVLDSDAPARLEPKRGAKDLEQAFIGYLLEAGGGTPNSDQSASTPVIEAATDINQSPKRFSFQRLLSYTWREALELQRDPVRATLPLVG